MHPGKIMSGGKVVAAFKGGSEDVEASYSRVDRFTQQLGDEFQVEIVDTIQALCEKVDAVLLESVDGRPHLEQAKPVIAAGKPLFIDKPMAGSLQDVIEIFRLAKEANVPCFSSSSLRYYPSLTELMNRDFGDLKGAISYGPCTIEPHHPDLFWYGVHPTEALFAVMGPGCVSVSRVHSANTDVVTGLWGMETPGLSTACGRVTPYKVTIFGSKAVIAQEGGGNYVHVGARDHGLFQIG